ncbi:MAG: hypothetical protein AB1489_22380 [Acidobacteriota bacterium]
MKFITLLKKPIMLLVSLLALVTTSVYAQRLPEEKISQPTSQTQPSIKKKPVARRTTKSKPAEKEAAALPSLNERLEDHRLAVRRGEKREPSAAFLIDEITVNGIYKSTEGYGAFLRASNGRTFFAYTGMPFFDGSVAHIEVDQVTFEQVLPDGKRRQVVKNYDPNALRAASIASQSEKDQKDQKKKEKKESKEEKKEEEPSEDDTSDDDE